MSQGVREIRHVPAILYVGNHAGYFLTHRLPIFNALHQAGFEIHVAVPKDSDYLEKLIFHGEDPASVITGLGFFFHPIPLNRSSINPLVEFRSFGALFRLYRKLQPDLVFHATLKPVIYGGIISRVTSIPSVVNLISGLGYTFVTGGAKRNILRKFSELAFKIALNRSNAHTLFQNCDDHQVFLKIGIINSENSSIIKGSGVDMREFQYIPEPKGLPQVVLISRMLWEKGIAEFVEAAIELRREGIIGKFVLIGDSDETNPNAIPRQQLQQWHDDKVVEWWGWRRDIPRILQNSHIVCMPSYYREGIPKALIEAAACGRPLVTADTPGCREIVQHGVNGFLVPAKDVPALTNALRVLLNDLELRQQMGRRSRDIVENSYSAQLIGSQVAAICNSLIGQSRPQ